MLSVVAVERHAGARSPLVHPRAGCVDQATGLKAPGAAVDAPEAALRLGFMVPFMRNFIRNFMRNFAHTHTDGALHLRIALQPCARLACTAQNTLVQRVHVQVGGHRV